MTRYYIIKWIILILASEIRARRVRYSNVGHGVESEYMTSIEHDDLGLEWDSGHDNQQFMNEDIIFDSIPHGRLGTFHVASHRNKEQNKRKYNAMEYGVKHQPDIQDILDVVRFYTRTRTANSIPVSKSYYNRNHLYDPRSNAIVHSGARFLSLFNNIKTGLDKVTNKVSTITKNVIDGVAGTIKYTSAVVLDGLGNMGLMGIKVGGVIIRPPLLGAENVVQTISYVSSLGKDLSRKMAHDIGSGLKYGWKAVTSLELPGWNVIMFFPNGMISIVNKGTNSIWYLKSAVGKSVSAALAFSIYVSLSSISLIIGPAMDAVGLSSLKLKPMRKIVDKFPVDEIEIRGGQIFGISNLKAVDNVTILRNDDSFLVLHVPYAIKNMTLTLENVTVTGPLGDLIEDQTMYVMISVVNVDTKISFQAGTLIKFVKIKLRVTELSDFHIKFDLENKNRMMDLIENLEDTIGAIIVDTINEHFVKFEKRISKFILEG